MSVSDILEKYLDKSLDIYFTNLDDGVGDIKLDAKQLKKMRRTYTSDLNKKMVTSEHTVIKYKNLSRYKTKKNVHCVEKQHIATEIIGDIILDIAYYNDIPDTRIPMVNKYDDEFDEFTMVFIINDNLTLNIIEESRKDKMTYCKLRCRTLIKDDISLICEHIDNIHKCIN